MQKRRLGQTDIWVSPIGLGTVKFGRNEGIKYPQSYDLPSDDVLVRLLDCARQLGINLLDTAPAYGTSEERLGKLLQGKRQDWIISTKAGERFVDGESSFDFSSSAIQQSIEQSLKRLGTDYLDIVLIHSNGDDEHIIKNDQAFETLVALKQAGKIRAYGMSTKTVVGGLLTVDMADVAMVTLNATRVSDREVIAYARQKQKGIFIKKALASGHLQPAASDDPVCDAMQFVLTEPGVTSVVVGTINPQHLQHNVACVAPLCD